jgi:hypothetical protein
MYVRLARREEREALAEFGEAYASYAANTPAFFPAVTPLNWQTWWVRGRRNKGA